jgi:hypothetical protein
METRINCVAGRNNSLSNCSDSVEWNLTPDRRGLKSGLIEDNHRCEECQEYQLCEIGVADRQDFYHSDISLNAMGMRKTI